MGSVTDLPIRQSTAPAAYEQPTPVPPNPPSLWQWMKAGFGFAVGAWVAVVLLAIPSAIILGRLYLVAWVSMLNAMLRH